MKFLYTLVILMLINIIQVSARHIVGGEATYKMVSTDGFIGGNAVYDVKFIIYRDAISGGADFDEPGFFGIFRKDSLGWTFQKRIDKFVENRSYIENVHDPCIVAPPNILYEKGEYKFRIELPIVDSTYKITYQRCCRTNFIVNILAPEATGATYYIDISPQAQLEGNNSPVFDQFPPSVLCANSFFEFDHSAKDEDGDSIVYEFFHPFDGGGLAGSQPGTGGQANDCNGVKPLPDNCPPPYPKVRFRIPYTFYDPLGGSPNVTIDRITGVIAGRPVELGQFVVGVRAREYRNGILIGTIIRDFQFNVTSCSPSVQAILGNANQTDINKFEVLACGTDTVTFINKSIDKDKIFDTYWRFDIGGNIYESNDWDATVVFPDTGTYTGQLILNRNTICNDSTDILINIYPGIHAKYTYQQDSCLDRPVLFNNESYSEAGPIVEYNWAFGDGNTSEEVNPKYKFTTPGTYNPLLFVMDENKCIDTFALPIDFYPVPDKIDFQPTHYLGCTPVEISFNNTTTPFASGYKIIWDFGDGSIDTSYSPKHLFDQEGLYTVKVRVISPNGCSVEDDFDNLLEIRKGPFADFEYEPENPNILNPKITFINNSEGAEYYNWEFGTGDFSFEFEPEYIYPDTGFYYAQLVATAENHCDDTIVKRIYISPDLTLFFPNAFTPNGDGVNDEFFPKGVNSQYVQKYNLTIWDRWGGLVFETNNLEESWTGAKNNTGRILPQGVYVYKFSYLNPKKLLIKGKGFVTLIK